MKFGLENISALCGALGHPEETFRSVLVAGTNGKGSVTATAEAALRAAGYRTGRYTSPHLVRLEERFAVDGQDVGTDALRGALARVRTAVVAMLADGRLDGPPTFFECTTAAAFELFRDGAVDIAVLEVGLGGRLDATNVVTPITTVIVSIDMDHQEQLGPTIASIAREKAGIIKRGVPMICGRLPPEADEIIRVLCEAAGAPMVRAHDRVALTLRPDDAVDVRVGNRPFPPVTLALEGAHQRQNAVVAIALLDELSRTGFPIPDEAIQHALRAVQWPGRIEHFRFDGIHVVLDAAHNPAGASALAAYLSDAGLRDATLLLGVMRDKDVRGILQALLAEERLWSAIVCASPENPRALPVDELAAIAWELSGGRLPIEVERDSAEALHSAVRRGRPIVAAGSIFLIGPLRDILR